MHTKDLENPRPARSRLSVTLLSSFAPTYYLSYYYSY